MNLDITRYCGDEHKVGIVHSTLLLAEISHYQENGFEAFSTVELDYM